MSIPQIEVFFVLNASTNLPLTGAAGGMSFSTYCDETGTPITPPTITEIGGGLYKFQVVFGSPTTHEVIYVLNTGTSGNPNYIWRACRSTDWALDQIPTLLQVGVGKWQIFTTGPNANKLIMYDVDGTTPLYTFDLKDSAGSPTAVNPFARIPE